MNFIQSLKESIGTFYYGLVSSHMRRLHSHLEVLEGRVSGLYAHLASRGVPMPTDESGTPLPQDTEHLLPTLRHLDTRKVECYETEVEDGTTIPRLLCSGERSELTAIIDHTDGWELNRHFDLAAFPHCKHLIIGAKTISAHIALNAADMCDVTLPNAETLNITSGTYAVFSGNIGFVRMPKLKTFYIGNVSVTNYSNIRGLELDECTSFAPGYFFNNNNSPTIEVMRFPKLATLPTMDTRSWARNMVNLIHFEIMEGFSNSANISGWTATNAVSADSSSLVYEGEPYANNREKFQSNFHEYIAKRLATFPESGSHPTLTLSQTVRDAITQQSEDLIVATKHWSLAPARTQV